MLSIQQALDMAWKHYQAGQWQQAEQLYQQILQMDPNQVDALHLLGLIAGQTGRDNLAVDYLTAALCLKPGFAEAHNNLGTVFNLQGKLPEAVASFRQAVRFKPDYAEAHNNLGIALQAQGKLAEGVSSLQEAVRFKPDHAVAHHNLGLALQTQGRLEEAVASYQQALRLKPDYAKAHSNLGVALQEQGRLEEAVASCQQALRLKPDYAEAHSNLGLALQEQGRLEEAVASYQQALRLKPDFAKAHNNLGVALLEHGRPEEAVASCQQALRLKPDYAEAHLNLAWIWLVRGDFERGWPEYEWRWKCEGLSAPAFRQPLWDGADLRGRTVLLYAEQGLGDTLQFIRYARLVKVGGATVLVSCQEPLVRLLGTCAGIDRLGSFGARMSPFDVQAPLLSLPRILGTTLDTVPVAAPYLHADPALVERWRAELGGKPGFKVGIGWQGNPRHAADRRRSMPLAFFRPLAEIRGVRLFSLQKGPGVEQLRGPDGPFPAEDLGARLDDWTDTAAVMKCLDW
jgi:tetratricopeptide (TPR) repeat protein